MSLSQEQITALRNVAFTPFEENLCDECQVEGIGRCKGKGVMSYEEGMFIVDEVWWKRIVVICANPSVVANVKEVLNL